MNLPEEILKLKDSLKSLPEKPTPKVESSRKKARREAMELWKNVHSSPKQEKRLPIHGPIIIHAVTPLVPGPLRNASTYEVIGGRIGAVELWVANPAVCQKMASKIILPKPKTRQWCRK